MFSDDILFKAADAVQSIIDWKLKELIFIFTDLNVLNKKARKYSKQ